MNVLAGIQMAFDGIAQNFIKARKGKIECFNVCMVLGHPG